MIKDYFEKLDDFVCININEHELSYSSDHCKDIDEVINCLAYLEKFKNIEEDFGLDLLEILTAKVVYIKVITNIAPLKRNKIVKVKNFKFDFNNKIMQIFCDGGLYNESFDNYKITWSFNKGDLKND